MGRAEIPAGALRDGMLLTQGERIDHFVLERLVSVRKAFRPILQEELRAD